jgi:hypothetical protein
MKAKTRPVAVFIEDGKAREIKENTNVYKISYRTKRIFDMLMTAEIGDTLSYDQLAAAVGEPVDPRSAGYSSLYSARRMAENEGVFFSAVTGVGIERVSQDEAVKGSRKIIRSIHSRAKRGKRLLNNITEYDELSPEGKQAYALCSTYMGAIALFTTPSKVKKIDGHIEAGNSQLPNKQLLAMFLGD